MQPITMHHEDNGGHTSDHEEQLPLLNTEGLRNELESLRDTNLVQETAAAFNGENFLDLCESIAAACGDAWIHFETHVAAQHLRVTEKWLTEALANWPTESAELVTQRSHAEAAARGKLKDTLNRIARNRVRNDMGEEQIASEIMDEPTKPEYIQPVPNTELSTEEEEQQAITTTLRENRINAVGDPKKRLADFPNPSEKLKFWVAAVATIIMGYLEFLMGFDITGAVLTPAGSFAVSLFITVGTNLLALFGTERLHHLLSYWGAKSNYQQYLRRTKNEGKKTLAAIPESPDMLTWIVGMGATLILAVCLIALIIYRQDVIREDAYLKGSEIAVYALAVSVIVTIFVHLRFTSPLPQHFFDREKELLTKLKPVQEQAKAKKAARDLMNSQREAQAVEEHQKLMAEYELAMEAYNADPVEAAITSYRTAAQDAEQELLQLIEEISEQIHYRSKIVGEYHNARKVLLRGYGLLIEDLAESVEVQDTQFDSSHWFATEQAKQITARAIAACPFAITNHELDKLEKDFQPASSIPAIALLTEVESILAEASNDERIKIAQRRSEEEVARIKERTEAKLAEQRLAQSKLRKLAKFVPIEEEEK